MVTEYMGIRNESFMKIAAVGTWMGDFVTAWMVRFRLSVCIYRRERFNYTVTGVGYFNSNSALLNTQEHKIISLAILAVWFW